MNQCQLMGRLVRDPELKYTPQGTAVTSFTLAVDRRFNRDKADYINIIAWRQTAEFVAKHFAKGQRVAIVGSIQTRSWEDNDGGKHKAVEIVADSVCMLPTIATRWPLAKCFATNSAVWRHAIILI